MTFRFDLFPVVATDDNPRANAKLFLLLSAVRETGSLHRASQQAGISYRHAWGLMRSWEDLLGQGILDMERGRGASLTRFGERLLRAEQRLREAIDPVVHAATSRFMEDLDEAAQPQTLVHFTGSHDPVVEMLSTALQQGPSQLHLDAVFCGGAEGLICLQERQSELAGFHVAPIQASGSIVHITLRKWLRDSTVRLIHVASRERGLLVSQRRADEIAGLADLVRSGATFLNRQRSSGTRVLFDQLLATHGLYADQIVGYEDVEFSNEKVADAIEAGRAEVGFGLHEHAATRGLHFVPLMREAYYFAMRKNDASAPWVAPLQAMLRSPDFLRRLEAMPGYFRAESTEVAAPQDVLPWFRGV